LALDMSSVGLFANYHPHYPHNRKASRT
jgi:hypothetical protein